MTPEKSKHPHYPINPNHPTTHGSYPVSGAMLYVETFGSGEPLVCLHSFSSNGRKQFGALIPHLSRHFTCYVVDLRAHGRSTHASADWTHERTASDIVELCESLGLPSAYFLAVSSGAMTMLRVAHDRPDLVRAMVLDSGTFQVPVTSRKWYKDPATLSRKLKRMYAEANEVYGPKYGHVLAKIFHDFRLPECDINLPLEYLAGIHVPTLLLSGDDDQFFPPQIHLDMARTIPGAELLRFPDTGHNVVEFYPERVADIAATFLKRH